jgi:uncharacterized cupredoxin-like copper-binding protein
MRPAFKRSFALIGVLLVLTVLGIAGCGYSSAGQSVNVTVTLYDTKIDSTQTTFTPGMHYHFTVMNKGAVNHEFMIMPQATGQGMGSMPMDQLDHMALARTGDMAPGMMKTFGYTFMSNMAGQHPEFGCYYPGHDLMRLPVSVTR